jgi:uncharacterized protein YceK
MKRKWIVLFCFLTVVLLSGCAAGVYPKGATEDYKLGYKDGIKAGNASGYGTAAGILAASLGMPSGGSIFVTAKLPDNAQKKIQGESLEYQRGFAKGWVHGVRLNADTTSLVFGLIFSEDD